MKMYLTLLMALLCLSNCSKNQVPTAEAHPTWITGKWKRSVEYGIGVNNPKVNIPKDYTPNEINFKADLTATSSEYNNQTFTYYLFLPKSPPSAISFNGSVWEIVKNSDTSITLKTQSVVVGEIIEYYQEYSKEN